MQVTLGGKLKMKEMQLHNNSWTYNKTGQVCTSPVMLA